MRLWVLAVAVLAGVSGIDILAQAGTASMLLRGVVMTPSGNKSDHLVVTSGDRITSVGPSGNRGVDVKGVILPGLIDLHNHYAWNVLPRWTPRVRYGNRYEWQEDPEYLARVSGVYYAMTAGGFICDMSRYAEVKALVNGATAGAGSSTSDRICLEGLLRNLDQPFDLPDTTPPALKRLFYEVFPFALSPSREDDVRAVGSTAGDAPRAVVMHVGEGVDAASRREYAQYRAHGFNRSGVVVVHGLAFTPAQHAELTREGAGLVWSPRSHLELYGKTIDPQSLNMSMTAIAPDWSPTGSSGMIDEIATAWKILSAARMQDEQKVFEMVTTNPARLAGVGDRLGTLAATYAADLIVLEPKERSPLQSLMRSNAGDIRLVAVNGTPRAGDPQLMKDLMPGATNLQPISVCGVPKLLNLDFDFQALATRLRAALRGLGSDLAPLAECN